MSDDWGSIAPLAKPAAYPPASSFSAVADRAFGKGKWTPTSEYRDPQHNRAVGGVPNSNHTKGTPADPGAYDIVVPGMNPRQVAAKLKAAGWGGSELPESNHLHTNAPDMSGWSGIAPLAQAAGPAPQGPQVKAGPPSMRTPANPYGYGTPGASVTARKPGVGEAEDLGGSIAARAHEGLQTMRDIGRNVTRNPLSALDLRQNLKGAGATMDLLLSPLGGTVDAAVQAGRKAFTPNPEQRALASDPEWNRKAGDIAEMLTPLPKAGSVAKGARVVGDAIGVQRKLSRAEAAASAAEKAATAARDAREAAMHRTRVQTLQRAGVQDLTPGQIKGGAARAKEVAQVQGGLAQKAYTARIERANDSFQRATYNQVLEEIGARYKPTAPVGHEGVRAVQRMVSYAYDRILPHVKLKVDTKLEEALAANVNEAEQLRNPEARNFYTSVDRSVRSQLTPGATLDGKTFKEIESDLTRDIAALKSNPLHRREASLLENYLEILREGAERSSPPEVAKRLKAVNAAYSKLAKVEEAAARNPGAGGKFNTEDLLAVVKKADKGTGSRHARFARGEATMQRWADTAHQVMGQGSDGERAAGLHVPYPSPHGVVTAGARTVARPVVNALTERSLQRAEKAARRKALRAKLPPVDTSGTGDALGGAGAEGAIVSGQQDH